MTACGFLAAQNVRNEKTQNGFPGVFYLEAERIGGKGLERVYYIVFKQEGKVFEEKAGRQFKDKRVVFLNPFRVVSPPFTENFPVWVSAT